MRKTRRRSESRYYCPLPGCDFNTGYTNRRNDHITWHQNPDTFTACGCGRKHTLGKYMQECMQRKAGKMPKRKKKKAEKQRFACQRPGCTKSYANKRALTDHVICHDYPNAFVCTQCDTRHGSRQSLRVCQNSHAEGRPTFPCEWPDCEQVFDQRLYLEDHTTLHDDPLAFACGTCGLPHKSSRMKDRCEVNHLNHPEAGHRCPRPECLAELPSGASLDAHEKRHVNARQYSCSHEDCDKTFNLQGDAKTHFKVAHGSGYCRACRICGKLSKTMQNLHSHIRTKHAANIEVFDLSNQNHVDICENAILHLKAQYFEEEQNVDPGVLRPDWELCLMSIELRQTYNAFWRDLAKRVLEQGLYPVQGFRAEVCAYWDDRKTEGVSQVLVTDVQYDELMSIVAAKGWHAYGVAAHFKLTRSLERRWFKHLGPRVAADLGTSSDELVAVARAGLLAEILGLAQDSKEADSEDGSSSKEGGETGSESESASDAIDDDDEDKDDDDGDDEHDDEDSDGGDDEADDGALKRLKKVAQQPPAKQRLPARQQKSRPSKREAQEKVDAHKEEAAQEQALQAQKEANKASAAARRAAREERERQWREENSDYDAEKEARKEKEGEEYRAAKAAQEKERQARKCGKFKPVHPSKRPK